MSVAEQIVHLPKISSYRYGPAPNGLRVRQPRYSLRPLDNNTWGFLAPPNWDSSTTAIGPRLGELGRVKEQAFNARPWALPKYFDLWRVDPLVGFEAPPQLPPSRVAQFYLPKAPEIEDPIPDFLEEVLSVHR